MKRSWFAIWGMVTGWGLLLNGVCAAGDRTAAQQFRVYVPPRLEISQQGGGATSDLTIRSSVELLVRLEEMAEDDQHEDPQAAKANLSRAMSGRNPQWWYTQRSCVSTVTVPPREPGGCHLSVLTIVPLD